MKVKIFDFWWFFLENIARKIEIVSEKTGEKILIYDKLCIIMSWLFVGIDHHLMFDTLSLYTQLSLVNFKSEIQFCSTMSFLWHSGQFVNEYSCHVWNHNVILVILVNKCRKSNCYVRNWQRTVPLSSL